MSTFWRLALLVLAVTTAADSVFWLRPAGHGDDDKAFNDATQRFMSAYNARDSDGMRHAIRDQCAAMRKPPIECKEYLP